MIPGYNSKTLTFRFLAVSFLFFMFSLFLSNTVLAKEKASSFDAVASEDSQIIDPEIRKERKIGRKSVAQIEEHWELLADPAQLVHLQMIVDRLKPHLERDIPYEVRIVRMDVPNAFCLPGGFIFFTTKMLDMLHSESEIAAIMAHEMVHVDQKHGLKMAAKANKVSLAALAVIIASGGALAPTVLAQVAQVAMTSSYTIEFEKEADSKGLDLLIAAGYSPAAMVTIMEGFMHEEMKQPVREYGIYMDHPESVERVESMALKLKQMSIRLERKYPLGLLRTAVKEENGRYVLSIDGTEVWSGPHTDKVKDILNKAQEVLNKEFQMELAPYDLELSGNRLRLRNTVLAQSPLPEEMSSLKTFRENLITALNRTHKEHPIAKYFK